jgi:hypothetical protein
MENRDTVGEFVVSVYKTDDSGRYIVADCHIPWIHREFVIQFMTVTHGQPTKPMAGWLSWSDINIDDITTIDHIYIQNTSEDLSSGFRRNYPGSLEFIDKVYKYLTEFI